MKQECCCKAMLSSISNGIIWAACSSNKAVIGHPEFCLLLPSIYSLQQYRGEEIFTVILNDPMRRKHFEFFFFS
uniref:Bm750 n=1 Tax=Brugia malayi TaxID=6279 RepID=A0A1I9G5L3_BRUMA|nr:Bm750 [Brugia malayi]